MLKGQLVYDCGVLTQQRVQDKKHIFKEGLNNLHEQHFNRSFNVLIIPHYNVCVCPCNVIIPPSTQWY